MGFYERETWLRKRVGGKLLAGGHGNEIKAAYSEQPSFGRAMTRKELYQSLDAKLEENKKLYGKTEADWIKEQCPNWQTMKFKFVGESKLYGYYEFIKELDKHPEENRQ